MTRETDLAAAATAAGLLDHDLLLVAKPDVPPAEAVADLRRRYPAAFPGAPKLRKDMTLAEMTAELNRAARERVQVPPPGYPPPGKKVDEMTLDEVEAFERHHHISISHAERTRRIGIRRQQQTRREGGW